MTSFVSPEIMSCASVDFVLKPARVGCAGWGTFHRVGLVVFECEDGAPEPDAG